MTTPVDTSLLDNLTRSAANDGVVKLVVGAVIPDTGGKVLLLHRAADDYLGGLWELPSGGVDPGETLLEALHREVKEETGLKVAAVGDYLGHFDYLSKSGKTTRQFNFTTAATGGTVTLTEHDRYEWVAASAGQEKVSSSVRTVLATWHAQCGG